jgi:hypothetical protein
MLCAFPIHVWALLMGFRDFSWVALRTNVWDAIGLLSYSLAFALVESTGVFVVLVIFGFFIPNRIGPEYRVILLETAFLITALWAIGGEIFSLLRYPIPGMVVEFLRQTNHPLRILWGTICVLVVISVVLPLGLLIRRNQFRSVMIDVFDRIATVSALYLFFDLVSIVIITVRNLRF